MGMFQVKVSVANPQSPQRSFLEPFWVDTGALYSFVPEGRLKEIGVAPKFTRDFVFADGKKDRRLVGEAAFSIEGSDETITCLVVFGPPESLFLLGATALENFGVQADPTTQKLRPITAVIGTALAGRRGAIGDATCKTDRGNGTRQSTAR
jgi:predicted aspartyl protease